MKKYKYKILYKEEKKIKFGIKVYHGTSPYLAQSIAQFGLKPNPNSWLVSRIDDIEEREKQLQQLPKELYVSTKKSLAMEFGREASDGEKPIVFSFILLEIDKIKGADLYIDDEIVILNKISPERLQVEYPKNVEMKRLKSKKEWPEF
jgi:hypothetical protein